MKRSFLLTVAFAAMAASSAAAEKPNFSGDRKIDVTKSNFGQLPAPASRRVEQRDPDITTAETQTGGAGEVTTTAKSPTYGAFDGMAGNVLLAFSVDGK